MKKFKFKSLTMRIWTTFTIIILIIIFSISLLYFVAYRRINEKSKIHDLKAAQTIFLKNKQSDPAIGLNHPIGPEEFKNFKNLKGIKSFNYDINTPVLDNNQFNNHIPQMPDTEKNTRAWMTSFIKGKNINDKVFKGTYNNKKYIFIISSSDDNQGKTYLITYMEDAEDNSILYAVICVGIVFIAIGFLTAKLVANYISKPLKELEDFTVRIAHKDWKDSIEVKSKDEIGRLADAMNRMQNELKHADQEEKMFLQSISHDLKTPVMVIMSHADAIMDGVYIDSVEKTAEIIRNEAISLEKKIKQMLYLNTLDYVLENSNENTKINLKEMMFNIINRFEVINSNIQWDLDLQDIFIFGNADKLQISIENIVDNALRYAKERIVVTLKLEDSKVVLEIYNDGPNIGQQHIDHIFNNLYKDKTGNFGLGLAISKKITDFYKGEIKAVNREKGVSFIIKYSEYER